MLGIHRVGLANLQGSTLIAAITSVCSMGFCLFGYDQGVMSGVVISSYWLKNMGNPSTLMVGTITALYDIGAIFGAIAASSSSEQLGRKRTLILGSVILIIGTILMGVAFERIQFMVARVVTGIGIGYITSVTPVYQSEISLPQHRGWQVCCQLTSMLGGLMLAYWINYGLFFYHSSLQWRFPLLFQIVFAVYVIAVTAFLPESPRWLMGHDATPARGELVLAKLRKLPMEHAVVQKEKTEIMDALALESKEEGSWGDLFKDNGINGNKRFYLALGIQFMQQLTGINIVTYYAPTLFQESLGMTQEMSLFLGCFVQLWYLIASFLTWFTIDRIGRRKLFITFAIGNCIVLVLEAICVSINTRRSSIAAVFFVFAFEACFTWGWMATVWVYPAEVLPLKIRAKGAALAAAADFLGNFIVVEITPPALRNIGYNTYIIFAVFNIVNAVVVWCFYPETAGQTLESIDLLFRRDSKDYDLVPEERAWYARLQWAMVPKSTAVVRRLKAAAAADATGASEAASYVDRKEPVEPVESASRGEKASEEHIESKT
ncbi:general substrate transporter [Amylocystis lapponica]|nr:general substrate transporter [Amylocystis lapponica]